MTSSSPVEAEASSQPLVSVVTPFYNTENYLAQCIESVLAQTYHNFEYILLNNSSTDRSLEIAEKYVASDARIRLIHNDHLLPQVQNYNRALAAISSLSIYCKIVQADDWIFPDCISSMVEAARSDSMIGIVSAYRIEGNVVTNCGLPIEKKILEGKQICKFQLADGFYIFGSPTSVMFRSEIVRCRQPFYPNGRYFEDSDVCYEILNSWKFAFVHQVLAYERMDNESISTKMRLFDPNWLLSKYLTMELFGQNFLTPIEYSAAQWRTKKNYYSFLSQNFFQFVFDRPFRDYHLKGIATIGLNFDKFEMAIQLAWELVDVCFNPKKTVGRVYQAIRGKNERYR